jgi:hypothetical protein
LSGDLVRSTYQFADIHNEAVPLSKVFLPIEIRDLLKGGLFTPEELELLLSGNKDLDPKEWRRYTKYPEMTEEQMHSPVIRWFWEYADSLTQEQLRTLLKFTTGASRTPAGGFAYLRGYDRVVWFNIALISEGGDEWYPKFHTCLNSIHLPFYSSKKVLVERFDFVLSSVVLEFGHK